MAGKVDVKQTSDTGDCELEEDLLEPMALVSQHNPGEDEDTGTSKQICTSAMTK